MATIVIPKEFSGRRSGVSGYVAGLLVEGIEGPAEVTFERAIRAGRPLETCSDGRGGAWLGCDRLRSAIARPAQLRLAIPRLPGLEEAALAGRRAGLADHPAPDCFVCGPDRPVGEGLRIFCGPAVGGLLAGTWTPHAAVTDLHAFVRREYVWAALTCPGAWAATGPGRPETLLSLAVAAGRLVVAAEPHVVCSWRIDGGGRLVNVGVAIARPTGEVCLRARATWSLAAAESVAA